MYLNAATLNLYSATLESQSIHIDESTRMQFKGRQTIGNGFDENIVLANGIQFEESAVESNLARLKLEQRA